MKFTCQAFPGEGGSHAVLVVVPDISWPGVRVLLDKSALKHNQYLTLDVSLPHKPRTTGPKSQNHHLRGHEKQIAHELGLTMSEVHETIKWELSTWPEKMVNGPNGERFIKLSEAEISSEICAEAIDLCHAWAAYVGITLVEK